MRRIAIALTAVTLLVGAGLSAQAPSFAGKWTLVPDPNAAAGGGGKGGGRGMGGGGQFCGNECTMTQDAKALTVTRTTQAGETKTVYNLDGSESKNTQTFGENSITSVSTAKWDGAKLVITTKTDVGGNVSQATTTVSLDAGGQLVVARTAPPRGGGDAVTTTQTYKKG